MTNLAKKLENQKPVLSIAHMASNTPFYCVEEAEIVGRNVEVAYYNENDPASEIEMDKIPVKALLEFMTEFYGETYSDHYMKGGEAVEDVHERNHEEYLKENTISVATEFINAKK